jgi:UDP-glucose 4-epimerase
MRQILVTGGAGFIGSHTCVALINAGFRVIILDNFCNSESSVIGRIETIAGTRPELITGDVRDRALLREVFAAYPIGGVIHFAALKTPGQSVRMPLEYFDCNVTGTLALLQEMRAAGIKVLVYSSSAAVYGDPARMPVDESFPLSANTPYARSKIIAEEMLEDLYRADGSWRIARLRYFNPAGAHPSGLLGENPKGAPDNLVPMVAQAASGRREGLSVFGSDYPTPDGTGVRDYLHVADLAQGHVLALQYLGVHTDMLTVNLSAGRGYSVLEVINAFERASGRRINYRIAGRRPGDVAECWALPAKAGRLLGWKASRTLDDMCRDAWRWETACIQSILEGCP